jgi:hypothetical protein
MNAVAGIGHAISDLLDIAFKLLTGGSTRPVAQAISDLLTIFKYGAVLVFLFLWGRYSIVVLGATKEPEGRYARREYDNLRENLARGGTPARLYQERLTQFLDWIDKFFGDAGRADRTLFPHAFGLKKPAPLWTAPAFDRCLLLALIYPIATIFLIWAVSGHAGPAEAALYLGPDLPGWRRGLAVAAIGLSAFAMWRSALATGWKQWVWGISAVAGAVAGSRAGGGLVAFAGAGAVAGAGTGAGAGGVAFAGAVVALSKTAIKHGKQGVFLSLFLPGMIGAFLGAADLLAASKAWDDTGRSFAAFPGPAHAAQRALRLGAVSNSEGGCLGFSRSRMRFSRRASSRFSPSPW